MSKTNKVPFRLSTNHEKNVETGSDHSDHNDQPVINDQLERTVWRKLDIWILPVVTLFFLLSFLVSLVDRGSNILPV
jgi:hypothetical protein